MKKLTVLIALALVLIIMPGCIKQKETGAIRVMHWGDVIEMGNVNKIIKDIKAKKGITVVQERAPAGNPYLEKLMTQAAANMAPDIIFVEASNFKELYDRGLLLNLSEFMKNDTSGEIDIKGYYPEIVDRFTIDGNLYVIPRDIAPIGVVFYNKEAFNDAGLPYPTDDWDWDKFLDTAKKLMKEENGHVVRYGFIDEWTMWDPWVYSNGGAVVDDVRNPKKCVLDSKAATDGMQFRADLSLKHKVAPVPAVISQQTQGWYGTAGLFVNGQVGMFMSGYWKSGFFRTHSKLDFDIVMFPKGPGGKRAFGTGGSGYAITSQCKNPQAAWEVLKRFSGEQGQRDLASQGGLQPAIMKLAQSEIFMDNKPPKNKKIMHEAVSHIVFTPLTRHWDEINMADLGPVLDNVWSGKETAAQAMKRAVPLINKKYFSGKKEGGK